MMRNLITMTACLVTVVVYTCQGANMTKAKNGDTVQLHYKGTLIDGTVFDSSEGKAPLEFTVGSGQVIPGFDKAVNGMELRKEKTFTIPAKEAYGIHDPALVTEITRDQIPSNIKLTKGLQLHSMDDTGSARAFTVIDFDDAKVKLDGNHSLAGKDLTFMVKLVSIK